MEEPLSRDNDVSTPQRRKIRKGTESCWECRRRKVRCSLTAITKAAICENCKRRRTRCVSQNYTEPSRLLPTGSHTETRLDSTQEDPFHIERGSDRPGAEIRPLSSRNKRDKDKTNANNGADLAHPSSLNLHVETAPISIQVQQGEHTELCRTLITAWPNQHDLNIICGTAVNLSTYTHQGIYMPYSSILDREPPSLQETLNTPSLDLHPVLIARKLLILSSHLQGIPPSSLPERAALSVPYRNIMSCAFETAVRLVNANEDLIRSVEGIECVLIEAMYHNHAGNLQQAWMAVRRAITVAQLMMLPRGLKSSNIRFLHQETRDVFNSDQICFRLVSMDCYLSLMLGLPRSSLEARFVIPTISEGYLYQPVDRMQRMHCVIADRILNRDDNDLSETFEIDRKLQQAADEMPTDWWLIPNMLNERNGKADSLREAVRFTDQFVHYHLLIRLHLPYMLRSSSDHRYDHSKISAVDASRETLIRFVAFCNADPAQAHCPGVDFLAFIATTVLCIAHVNSCRWRYAPLQDSSPGTTFSFLVHSRASDRGLMERALAVVELTASTDTESVAFKVARVLRDLLLIEANAASGTAYDTNTSGGDENGFECNLRSQNDTGGLCINIPHFGTVSFERCTVSRSFPQVTCVLPPSILTTNIALPVQPVSAQSMDTLPTLPDLSSHLSHGRQLPLESSVSSQHGQDFSLVYMPQTGFEWDLQGVDTAFFENLFCGVVEVNTVIPEV